MLFPSIINGDSKDEVGTGTRNAIVSVQLYNFKFAINSTSCTV